MVNQEADFANGKPQVVTYSAIGFGLHFPSLEIETAYRDVASSALYSKVKYFRRLTLPLSMCLLALHAFTTGKIQLFSGSLWDLTLRFEPSIAIDVAFMLIVAAILTANFVLHFVTKKNADHLLCLVVNLLPGVSLCLNPIRAHRVLPGLIPSYKESIESINGLGQSCDLDYDFNAVEMEKDTRMICATLLCWGCFSGVCPVRSNTHFSWTLVFWILSCCIFFLPPLKPNYGSSDLTVNIMFLFLGSLSSCYVTYIRD